MPARTANTIANATRPTAASAAAAAANTAASHTADPLQTPKRDAAGKIDDRLRGVHSSKQSVSDSAGLRDFRALSFHRRYHEA
jgi:hypothetical protein